jgi:hypothetical protein
VDLPPSYRSFLVRLWRDPPGAGGAWRGEVESIQSGELVCAGSLDEVIGSIRRAAGIASPPAAYDTQPRTTDSEGTLE